ncbi:MAG: hypothetical protein SOX14_03670 [Ruminococcus callidus]|nr:hypothetical protein [Ruminococcus callidus]
MEINNNKLSEEILLADSKLLYKNIIDPNNDSKDSFELLMHSFVYNIQKKNIDYESQSYIKKIYQVLGWNGENFDVINSFWTTFSYAMHSYYPKDYPMCNSFGKRKVKICKYPSNKKIKTFPEKYINKNDKDLVSQVKEIGKAVNLSGKLTEFASLCHCIANFMPCPAKFNLKKNENAGDYLPLMINKIQQDKDYDDVYMNWHRWFVDNREKYCLEPYYYIEKIGTENKIVGIPLFKSQSLSSPFPKTPSDINECLEEILKRIKCRAKLILMRYNQTQK